MACSQTLTPRHGHTVWGKIDLSVSLYLHLVVMTLILIRSWSDESPGTSTSKEKCGVLSYMSSLDSIGPIMPEIHNLVFSWRVIKLWRHATVTLCDEKSIFRLVCMSMLLWWHSSWLEVDLIKPWDKYVKVKMWNMAKMATKCKMARFLLWFS